LTGDGWKLARFDEEIMRDFGAEAAERQAAARQQ
jgi:hypothetical protein